MAKSKTMRATTFVCIATSPSQHPKHNSTATYSVFIPRKTTKEVSVQSEAKYEEASLQQKSDPSTPTKIERSRDSGNPYRMQ